MLLVPAAGPDLAIQEGDAAAQLLAQKGEDDWEDDAPEPGPQPPLPRKQFVAQAGPR